MARKKQKDPRDADYAIPNFKEEKAFEPVADSRCLSLNALNWESFIDEPGALIVKSLKNENEISISYNKNNDTLRISVYKGKKKYEVIFTFKRAVNELINFIKESLND